MLIIRQFGPLSKLDFAIVMPYGIDDSFVIGDYRISFWNKDQGLQLIKQYGLISINTSVWWKLEIAYGMYKTSYEVEGD